MGLGHPNIKVKKKSVTLWGIFGHSSGHLSGRKDRRAVVDVLHVDGQARCRREAAVTSGDDEAPAGVAEGGVPVQGLGRNR